VTKGWRQRNPEKAKEGNKRYREKNKDIIKVKQHISYMKHQARNLEYARNYREKNKEILREIRFKYYAKNRERENARTREINRRNRITIIGHYSDDKFACNCCGEKEMRFLTVDHIAGGGRQHLKSLRMMGGSSFYYWLLKNNFPKGYQILCFNCNMGRAKNGGLCPHRDLKKLAAYGVRRACQRIAEELIPK